MGPGLLRGTNGASGSRGPGDLWGLTITSLSLSFSVIRREHGDPLIEELNPGDALEPEGRGTGEGTEGSGLYPTSWLCPLPGVRAEREEPWGTARQRQRWGQSLLRSQDRVGFPGFVGSSSGQALQGEDGKGGTGPFCSEAGASVSDPSWHSTWCPRALDQVSQHLGLLLPHSVASVKLLWFLGRVFHICKMGIILSAPHHLSVL